MYFYTDKTFDKDVYKKYVYYKKIYKIAKLKCKRKKGQ